MKLKTLQKISCLILFLIFIFCVFCLSFLNTPIKEGVVFTKYDNFKYFNKPWSKFCIQPNPSCNPSLAAPPLNNNPMMVGGGPTGCWCSNLGKSPLDNNCTDLDFDPFVEVRR